MGRTVTLGNLVSRAKVAADQEGQSTISDTNWKEFIDRAYRQLYSELAKPGVGYFDTEATITSTGVAAYALPSDHLFTVGVDYKIDSAGRREPLKELMRPERSWHTGQTGTSWAYEVFGTNVALYPTPPAGQQYIHTYIPQPADISAAADGTLIEMATLDGEDFILWTVVFFARDKLEQDTRTAAQEREAARVRVAEDAVMRSFMNPRRIIVQDDYGDTPRYPGDWENWR
jgi:hypothetical protein